MRHMIRLGMLGLFVLTLASVVPAQTKRELMQDAHALVFDHTTVSRTVERLPNGVRTRTTTNNPELLPTLRRHPREMSALYRDGGMVRAWDPVFRALAEVSDRVHMEVRDIDGGVDVLLTSEDPKVVALIQAHADKVSDMVQRGAAAMREATPLPAQYTDPAEHPEATPGDEGAPPTEGQPRVDPPNTAEPQARDDGSCCRGGACRGDRGQQRGRRP